jgi:hypothetical protein
MRRGGIMPIEKTGQGHEGRKSFCQILREAEKETGERILAEEALNPDGSRPKTLRDIKGFSPLGDGINRIPFT